MQKYLTVSRTKAVSKHPVTRRAMIPSGPITMVSSSTKYSFTEPEHHEHKAGAAPVEAEGVPCSV